MVSMTGDGRLGNPGGQAHTVYDGEPWFDGKSIQSLDNSQVANDLIDAGVPGVSHTNGRQANLEAWHLFLEDLRKKAATQAVSKFLIERKIT